MLVIFYCKNSRKKKLVGGASSSSSSSPHQETPTPRQLSQDRINEKNELLEKFKEGIKSMKDESESHKDDGNTLTFLSAVISATLHAVTFALRIPNLIPSSKVPARISTIMEIDATQVFKKMSKIISDAIMRIKPNEKGSKTNEKWKRRCRKNVEELEKKIKEEDYKDELSIKVLDVIVMTLMPELGRIREASTCSCCKMINWKHKNKVLANTRGKLEVLEKDVVRRLEQAVNETTADS